MTAPSTTLHCQYRYDPLDRLVHQTQPDTPVHQRFYCKSRLATEIQGATKHSIIQHDDLLLAQQQHEGNALDTTLLATDLQRSVLHTLKKGLPPRPIAYSPYGHRPVFSALLSLLGFNGERPDPVTGCYLLGNGYRAFNPVLMRFNSPDSWSPFGKGGLNSYTYCLGNPTNRSDPSGHISFKSVGLAMQFLSRLKKGPTTKTIEAMTFTKSTTNTTYLTQNKYTNASNQSFLTTYSHTAPMELKRPISLRSIAAGKIDSRDLQELKLYIDLPDTIPDPNLADTISANIGKINYITPDSINSVKIETYKAALSGKYGNISRAETTAALTYELQQPGSGRLHSAFPAFALPDSKSIRDSYR
ncbi:RHS repeat-associated core domain-containing protein [Pseudomonas moorei]|uniref:RHS repeat-associated core domain-containing protein n=1 Tax=Pseudomonas moorei TaxID=395599 RepID=UPI001FF3161F|nr:RHS repeat-associated core domain-containing protein [Pseudomonas moorei]